MTDWNDDRASQPEPESSTGKVLFYFFGVVVLCAVALAVGYMMGKRATPSPVAETGAPASTVAGTGAPKPAPARPVEAASVDNNASEIAETPAAPSKAAKSSPDTKSTAKGAKTPEISGANMAGFMVQVAAVSRQEDADALAGALRKKQYPVFVMPGGGTDKLLHVQVGPFADLKDAEAMKAKLAADGYNAIVKK
jgi:DedD protein